MDSVKLKLWLDRFGQCLSLSELSDSAKQSIMEPIRSGDPVFTTVVSRELLQTSMAEACLDTLLSVGPSPIRILLCEIIFCICKCPAAECRLFVASQIPALIWSSWILDSMITGENEKSVEDWSAVEIATIAAFQQDIIVHPQLPCVKIPSLREKSIYHMPKDLPNQEKDIFPFNFGLLEFVPDALMQPTQNIGKIDENSRLFLYYRLSRVFNESLSKMPNYSRLIFCIVIACLTCRETEQIKQIVSNTSLPNSKKESLLKIFEINTSRSFQSNDNLFSIWNDALIYINIPIISMIQELLLERAKRDSLPMTLLQLLSY